MYAHIYRRAWVVMEKTLAFSICDLIILICIFSSKKFSLKPCMFTILFCSAFPPINCNKIISPAHKNLSNDIYIYIFLHTHETWTQLQDGFSVLFYFILIYLWACAHLILCLSIFAPKINSMGSRHLYQILPIDVSIGLIWPKETTCIIYEGIYHPTLSRN